MTRKQAISTAIQALSKEGSNQEAIQVLQTMSDELPLNRWSETAIYDSVEQFILDHGRVPNASDFKLRGLPPHPVIKNRFGITVQEWLAEHYPVEKPDPEVLRKNVTDPFITEYLRLKPCSGEKFDARRSTGIPCWFTVAQHNGTTRWRALLEKLDLPIYNNLHNLPPQQAVKREYKVSIHVDPDFLDAID